MGIDNITAKILSDASLHVETLISEAQEEAKLIIENAVNEAGAIKEQLTAQLSADTVSIKHRKQSSAELETRKMLLAAKHRAVSDVLEAAVDHLAGLEPKKYVSFLAGKIVEIGVKDGELLLNAKDRASIGEKLVKSANKWLKDGRLTLSEQTIDAKGGFVLKCGALEINSSLETIIDSVKETVLPDLVSILFQE